MLKVIILFLLVINIFNLTGLVYAEDKYFLTELELKAAGITEFEKINPNLLIYPFKRLKENIKYVLIFNKQKKNEYLFDLLDIRFKELVYIINSDKIGFISFSADRFNTTIGQIKNRSIKLDERNNTKMRKYLKALERLRDRYHSGSASWEKIQQVVDTVRTII